MTELEFAMSLGLETGIVTNALFNNRLPGSGMSASFKSFNLRHSNAIVPCREHVILHVKLRSVHLWGVGDYYVQSVDRDC